jgi:hypothetical protein
VVEGHWIPERVRAGAVEVAGGPGWRAREGRSARPVWRFLQRGFMPCCSNLSLLVTRTGDYDAIGPEASIRAEMCIYGGYLMYISTAYLYDDELMAKLLPTRVPPFIQLRRERLPTIREVSGKLVTS